MEEVLAYQQLQKAFRVGADETENVSSPWRELLIVLRLEPKPSLGVVEALDILDAELKYQEAVSYTQGAGLD